jgi:hypothetical protein
LPGIVELARRPRVPTANASTLLTEKLLLPRPIVMFEIEVTPAKLAPEAPVAPVTP